MSASQVIAAENKKESAESKAEVEEVVVTGSRLKRDTYSSLAPMQVISASESQAAGLINPSEVLQNLTAAAGTQIDLTFSNFVTSNGPGASTLNLRGLGANRALVLINGRRVGPAGVEGAPSSPDLNMVPSLLVDQYDILLDGASSIYGSDAVAGVSNIILKTDFDGFEYNTSITNPDAPGGLDQTHGFTWGFNGDNGFIGVGGEYKKVEATKLKDREWTADCLRHIEVTDEGEIRSNGLRSELRNGMPNPNGCVSEGSGQRLVVFPTSKFGHVYYDPTTGGNSGIPNFSEAMIGRAPVDLNQDGINDINYFDYDVGTHLKDYDLYPEQEYVRLMAYGEYTFDGDMGITPYFETLYSSRETHDRGMPASFWLSSRDFPQRVPASNPFNPCGENGIDCGAAYNEFIQNPIFIDQYQAVYGKTPEEAGLALASTGPTHVYPGIRITGDRADTRSEVEQYRFVSGVKGDLPQLDVGSLSDWTFDFSNVISYAKGNAYRPGIREDRLYTSLYTTVEDPNNPGQYICGDDNNGDGIPDGTDGCVPVNLFAPSLYEGLVGDFATDAERDYLMDTRTFETTYLQTVTNLFAGGKVAELPAGDVSVGFGLEYRFDEIDSRPDELAAKGLLINFFADEGAKGRKYSREFYAEAAIPLLSDLPLVDSLDLELAARVVEDQFYGTGDTYSVKLGYRPVDWLTLRSTLGTSFRAPNVREVFLHGQTGFVDVSDPCVVPETARNADDTYNAAEDTREAHVLQNCRNQGIDPTTLLPDEAVSSVEVARGGNVGLKSETSESFTAGFSFVQPWTEAFDLNLGATYWQIDVSDTIISPGAGFIVRDCFTSVDGKSPFCDRITRVANDDGHQIIRAVDGRSINRDGQQVRGVDINMDISTDFELFDRASSVSLGLDVTNMLESTEIFRLADGTSDDEDTVGTFGKADWNATANLTAKVGNFSVTWNTKYISDVEQLEEDIDDFGNVFTKSGGGDTCLGRERGDVECRDVGFADEYFLHTVSARYQAEGWTMSAGVRNVFNEAPPEVDDTEIRSISNAPNGYGYDLRGRRFFLNVNKKF